MDSQTFREYLGRVECMTDSLRQTIEANAHVLSDDQKAFYIEQVIPPVVTVLNPVFCDPKAHVVSSCLMPVFTDAFLRELRNGKPLRIGGVYDSSMPHTVGVMWSVCGWLLAPILDVAAGQDVSFAGRAAVDSSVVLSESLVGLGLPCLAQQ